MKNKIYHTKTTHKICAFVLVFCFIFISLAQAFHHHENHSHCNNSLNYQTKQNLSKHVTKTCQICDFTLNKNQAKVLSTSPYFNFKKFNNMEMLQPNNYVAFYTSKHLSLFSGTSPPTA